MKTTTLNRIRAHPPSLGSWEKLLYGLGKTQADDEPLSYATILEICGLNDALWAARAEPQYNWRLLAVAFARRVQHLYPYPQFSECLDITERYANGQATDEELAGARALLGWDAGPAAWIAWQDSGPAARVALIAQEAAWNAAIGNVLDAARAAQDAAWNAERKEQEKLFLEFVSQ